MSDQENQRPVASTLPPGPSTPNQGNQIPSPQMQPQGMPQRSIQIEQIQLQLPYPPPSILQQYNNVLPGLAQTLVEYIHKETEFRHDQEGKRLDAEIALKTRAVGIDEDEVAKEFRIRRWGLWAATVITLVLTLPGAWALIKNGNVAWSTALFSSSGITALVLAFLRGSPRIRKNESSQKQVKS